MKKLILVLISGLLMTGCSEEPRVVVRRVVVEGDLPRFVGEKVVSNLKFHGVKITESALNAPILTATSKVENLGNTKLFTLEINDGAGLVVKEVVSTQDASSSTGPQYIMIGVERAVTEIIRQLKPKETAPPKKSQEPPKRYTTS